jgi:four helix bundle protein
MQGQGMQAAEQVPVGRGCDGASFKEEMSDRLLEFAAQVIELTGKLNRTYAAIHIGKQLLDAATSSGANYEEACGAESRADFAHKLQVVLKELRESVYWLRLLMRAKLGDTVLAKSLLVEGVVLSKIVGKSVATTRLHRR